MQIFIASTPVMDEICRKRKKKKKKLWASEYTNIIIIHFNNKFFLLCVMQHQHLMRFYWIYRIIKQNAKNLRAISLLIRSIT